MNQTPSGARFNTWLARAAIHARETAGLRREAIATRADVGLDQVRRFELGRQTPRELDRIIAVYAESAGLEPVELYQRAIDLWRRHGIQPRISAPDEEPDRPLFPDELEDDSRGRRAG